MHPAPAHVDILDHADLGVAEVIGADPGRHPLIIDERGHRLSEAGAALFPCRGETDRGGIPPGTLKESQRQWSGAFDLGPP
jgi:hypothetical protein